MIKYMVKKNFRAETFSIKKFLDDYIFDVPTFQRRFDWSTKEVTDLWDGIIANIDGSNVEPYFIGSIICLEPEDENERYSIIDGQQRLFTLSLFFVALREAYQRIKKNFKSGRFDGLAYNIDNINGYLYERKQDDKTMFVSKIPRLYTKGNQFEIWQEIIDDGRRKPDNIWQNDGNDSQSQFIKNLYKARKLVDDYTHVTQGKEESRNDIKLSRIKAIQTALEKVILIVIFISDESQVYSLFEALNATGKELSVADLVKNAALRVVNGSKIHSESLEKTWNKMEDVFDNAHQLSLIQKFFRHQWISENGYISGSKLYEKIKKDKLIIGQTDKAINYANNLLRDANLYSAIRSNPSSLLGKDIPNTFEGNKIVKIINAFSYIGVEQVYELILSYLNKYISNQPNFTTKQLMNFIQLLWVFCFRAIVILGVNPSSYEKKFADHCKYVNGYNKINDFDRMYVDFFNELKSMAGSDNEVVEKFIDAEGLFYNVRGKNGLVTYVLAEILKSKDPGIEVSMPTIEHIIPQDTSKIGLSKVEVESFIHKVGNLTVLHDKDNKTGDNNPIEIKARGVYAKSHFSLNRELSEDYWVSLYKSDPLEATKRRCKVYAETAAKIWKL